MEKFSKLMENTFKLRENGTTVKTEIIAGVTTFMTMAYILAVNPNILSSTGMDHGAVFTATALAAFLGSLLMALFANYPFALAPGMGLNPVVLIHKFLLHQRHNHITAAERKCAQIQRGKEQFLQYLTF